MHKTFKRNFQIMSGADWLAQLCRHIPDRFERLVRYAGRYSNRSTGKRRRNESAPAEVTTREIDVREAALDPPEASAPILTYHPVPDIV